MVIWMVLIRLGTGKIGGVVKAGMKVRIAKNGGGGAFL